MEPWQSWILVGIIGAGAAYYYATTGQKKRHRGRTAVAAEANHHTDSKAHIDGKEKRKREKDTAVSTLVGGDKADPSSHSTSEMKAELPKKRKGNKKQPINPGQGSGVDIKLKPETSVAEQDDEEISNLEFAKQLNSAQIGTSLKKPDGPSTNKKGKKKAKPTKYAPEIPNGHAKTANDQVTSLDMSRTSSTTGAEADDDLSPANSPDLGATSAKTASGTDISDMLEAPVKGPSVLRVTEPSKPQSVKQTKAKAPAPEAETKKQRQNRKKREEQKALREETEKERRVLLEKQLRTAREAEGRPAKNGLGQTQVPSTNAWNSSSATDGNVATSSSKSVAPPLLDTLEDNHSAASSSGVGVNGFSSDHPPPYRDLPSEEEQIRMLSEMDSDNAWSTVDKGGKAKKKAKQVTQTDLNTATHSPASNMAGTSSDANEPSTYLTVKPQSKTSSNQQINTSIQPTSTAKDLASSQKSEAKLPSETANNGNATGDANSSAHTKPNTADPANTAEATLQDLHHATSNLSVNDALDTSGEGGKNTAVSTDHSDELEQGESAGATTVSAEPKDEHTVTGEHSESKHEAISEGGKEKVVDPLRPPIDSSKYPWQHDGPLFKKWIARNDHIKKTLDRNVWNYDNIKDHPFYDERWPWALIGHPLDSDWVAHDPDFD